MVSITFIILGLIILEFAVAFIQAYVFTLLAILYLYDNIYWPTKHVSIT